MYVNRILLLTLVSVAASVPIARADDVEGFKQRLAVKATVSCLEVAHLSKPVVNVKLSRKWFDAFFESLDPRRLYFLQSDLDSFADYRDRLGYEAETQNNRFAASVLKLYQSRLQQSNAITRDYLQQDFDFTVNESCSSRFVDFAQNKDALRERSRLTLKLELLSERVHGRDISSVKTQIEGRLQMLSNGVKNMTEERWFQIYLQSLAKCIDPHSAYLSSKTLRLLVPQNSLLPRFSLGIKMRQRNGLYQIESMPSRWPDSQAPSQIVGWDLVGFRQLDGTYHDLAEFNEDDFHRFFGWGGPLADDAQVDLELRHPNTWQRMTVRVYRDRSPKICKAIA